MKWVSHIAVAGAIAAPIDPMAVPVAALGATAPDWLEWLLAFVGQKVKHRTATHYLTVWLLIAAFGAFLWDYRGWITWFALGAASHWVCDSLTIQGVPLGWWSDRRVHLFGGRHPHWRRRRVRRRGRRRGAGRPCHLEHPRGRLPPVLLQLGGAL